VSVCGVLLSALLIKLFDAIEPSLAQQLFGIRNTLPLVVVIVSLEVGILGILAIILWRQISFERSKRQREEEHKARLRRLPTCDWPLAEGQRFACFLSHYKVCRPVSPRHYDTCTPHLPCLTLACCFFGHR
jgi:hypothetical protein